jgi:hypothetical protein
MIQNVTTPATSPPLRNIDKDSDAKIHDSISGGNYQGPAKMHVESPISESQIESKPATQIELYSPCKLGGVDSEIPTPSPSQKACSD